MPWTVYSDACLLPVNLLLDQVLWYGGCVLV